MTLEKKLNELIGEGINITKQAQEDGASYSTDPDNYLDNAYKIFNDWRQEIKDFIYNEKIGSDINVFFFKEDSVNRFLGLAEYLDPENKNKQRELLKSIRIETSIKLEKLIELKKEQLEKISKKPERVESSFWVTKDKDKYSYNDKLLRIKNQTTDYFIIFDVAYHLAEKGGNIKYDKIKECCKKRGGREWVANRKPGRVYVVLDITGWDCHRTNENSKRRQRRHRDNSTGSRSSSCKRYRFTI